MRRLAAIGWVAMLSACALVGSTDVGPATWAFAPGQDIGPETTEFVAMVTERDCASGQSSEGRIVGPEVEWSNASVTVTFTVRSPAGEFHDCPSNPPTAVHVALEEPIGDRVLLDGGRTPPEQPPECANRDACE
jgi:hypothetical protein